MPQSRMCLEWRLFRQQRVRSDDGVRHLVEFPQRGPWPQAGSVGNGPDRAIGPPPALPILLIPHYKNPNHPQLNGLYPVML
jgi:hypothetical protein